MEQPYINRSLDFIDIDILVKGIKFSSPPDDLLKSINPEYNIVTITDEQKADRHFIMLTSFERINPFILAGKRYNISYIVSPFLPQIISVAKIK